MNDSELLHKGLNNLSDEVTNLTKRVEHIEQLLKMLQKLLTTAGLQQPDM